MKDDKITLVVSRNELLATLAVCIEVGWEARDEMCRDWTCVKCDEKSAHRLVMDDDGRAQATQYAFKKLAPALRNFASRGDRPRVPKIVSPSGEPLVW